MDQNLLGAIIGIVGRNGGGGGGGGTTEDAAARAAIAPDFSTQESYSAGDFVWHSNALYRFTSDHSAGSWDGTNADEADIGDVINALEVKTVSVSGATPSITGVDNHRYMCGEVATLAVQAPASGCIDVTFESGSTATVLTVTSAKSGVTAIKWANGFDPTSLDANTTYEINILDGEYGVVGSWT